MVNKTLALCALVALLAFAVAEVSTHLPQTMLLVYSTVVRRLLFAIRMLQGRASLLSHSY